MTSVSTHTGKPGVTRPRFTKALLVAAFLSGPSISQEPEIEPGGETATPAAADFTGTWKFSATVQRSRRFAVGMRLRGVSEYTQEDDRVSGTTTLVRQESRVEGSVEDRTLFLQGRHVGGNCRGVFQATITMSTSGELLTGEFSGQNCDGVIEATIVGRRADSPRANRNSSLVEILEEGEQLLLVGAHYDAVGTFREALRRADEPSYRTQIGLARSHNGVGTFEDGREAAREAVKIARGPEEASDAYYELGIALLAESNDQTSSLNEAEQAFQQALDVSGGRMNKARNRLGQVLLKLERDPEGVAILQDFVRLDPYSPNVPQAQALIKNPRRAREHLIPDFETVTLDGRSISSEDLQNRVVLVDFWGSWCAPCVKALPGLRRLSRKTASDPFVLLSVSSDSDEDLLRTFIEENEMDWTQTWDEDRVLARTFEVKSWPTYFLFDHNGVFVFRDSGWNSRDEAQLNKLVIKTIKSAKKATKK